MIVVLSSQIWSIYNSIQQEQELVENNILQNDGGPFFPIGIYHVSWAGEKADKLSDLRTIAEAGFNTIHPALKSEDTDFMDLAAQLGILVLPENNDPNGLEQLVATFNSHPALLGWSIADDFNHPDNDDRPSFVRSQEEIVRAHDTESYTYITGVTSPYRFSSFLGISDIIAVQTYSVPFEPLSKTYEHTLTLRRSSYPHQQTIFTNIQSFAYPEERPPTYDEIRNMTYQALLAGTDGIIYYTFLDINWYMPDHPTTWTSLVSVVKELNDLMPFWLSGQHRQINTNTASVIAGLWTVDNQQLLVLVNIGENDQEVNLPIGKALSGYSFATPYDNDSSFTIDADHLSGTIIANDTQVFLFEEKDNPDL